MLLFSLVIISCAKVRLVNNGYEGVIIAINPNIPENTAILRRLEVRFLLCIGVGCINSCQRLSALVPLKVSFMWVFYIALNSLVVICCM